MTTDATIAKILLEVSAVTLRPDEPFRYSSGILSPIYTDNRVLLSYQPERKKVGRALEDLVRAAYPSIEAVAGTATAGIPWAAWLASGMNIPMVYVRDRAKRHGQQNQIEGVLKPGSKTLIVEDLVSTGKSCLNAAMAVRRAGAEPLGVVAIFTYQMKEAVKAFQEADVPLHALTNFRTLTDVAARTGQLTPESQAKVLDWATDPAGWAKRAGVS